MFFFVTRFEDYVLGCLLLFINDVGCRRKTRSYRAWLGIEVIAIIYRNGIYLKCNTIKYIYDLFYLM